MEEPGSRSPTGAPRAIEQLLILENDTAAAQLTGDLIASRHKKVRPGELRDRMIADIVIARQAMLATRNPPHFDDLSITVISPWVA
ncbi:MAG: hypothetical protein M3O09_18965 [Acidobacteriota bacterium]|nr:hypothetical protein [Acidobacteriota bacterium]